MAENNSSWTFTTLEKYLVNAINAQDRRIEQYFTQLDKAINKAEEATEKRFQGVNEFRAALEDLTRSFVPRTEIETTIKGLTLRVENVEKSRDALRNMKQGGEVVWAYVMSAIAMLISIASIILRK